MRALNLETEGLGRERAADGVGRACQRPSCGLWGGRVTPRHVLEQLCPEHAHALSAPSAVPPTPRLPGVLRLSHPQRGQAWEVTKSEPRLTGQCSRPPTPHPTHGALFLR